ncbi:pilus assembly protein PilA [Actinoplanes sp. ATCC 53533]|uniref:prepilin-type N-terminal cleavage/methylation domain-containing protein n=1 Tax=Actinoplanes sp. ATCC 53533 TaxID=1288362 RepID=UPI000F7AA74C|nr:prepilin-type N-terminal cleavage/methylation domain-containing protein [Actinoplanes sp. ATCC 53533]RSM51806.1 pilus assembly protein PilA [Actinoplanes sp. ATCC 53533]
MQDIISRLRAKKQDEGFTLIELLVVVVIIGVLVAIAVPVYLNYRQGAADKSAQSDVRGAVSAIEQYYTNNGNTYPATIASTTGATSITLAAQTNGTAGTITLSDKTQLGYNYVAGPPTTYVLCGNNTGGSGKWYKYDSAGGGSVKASTVTTPSLTAC